MQLCGSFCVLWHCLYFGLEWKLTFSSPVATAEYCLYIPTILWELHFQKTKFSEPYLFYLWASLVAEMVENLPTMKETWVQSLDEENPLDKGTDTHCSILAWRIPWAKKPGELYSPWGHKESDTIERITLSHNFLLLFFCLTQILGWSQEAMLKNLIQTRITGWSVSGI